MTIVVGTAGHIDHGKTSLLRALTGIDADRLPEERRRGMTLDVGYAHLPLDDGTAIDFVDVPGHDRLVGNMLVGAGEIDAALLVIAADDGPHAQTHEHLALLDALAIPAGIAVVTKIDTVEPDRVAGVVAAVARLLEGTSLVGSPVIPASSVTGEGLDAVLAAVAALRDRVRPVSRPPSLAVDRVFTVKGRGLVVTGTLRGGPLARGDVLRVVPAARDAATARIREIQVHGVAVDAVAAGGRTALNLAGIDGDVLHRGVVLTADAAVVSTERVLALFDRPVRDRTRARVHAGTAAVDAAVGRSGRDARSAPDGRPAGIVRFDAPIALRPGDRFVLRRGPAIAPIGGVVLDTAPPRGLSRRRQTDDRVASLVAALVDADDHRADDAGAAAAAARLDLHGAISRDGGVRLAPDVDAHADAAAVEAAASRDEAGGAPIGVVRSAVAVALRRTVSIRRDEAALAAIEVVDRAVAAGRLVREGELVRTPGAAVPAADPDLQAAMDRLEAALAVTMPPSLAAAARTARCPAPGIRALERSARIVVLEPDLAYAMTTYRDLAGLALRLAAQAPLTPAAFRDATGTSRKYVMAILEDLDRRAILRRTPDGHVPGPRAPTTSAAPSAAPSEAAR